MFISIEGGDGTGKSTQIQLLCDWLRKQGAEVVLCRDPGTTRLGESVRELLLHRHDLSMGRTSEMLLYMAARAQMTEEVIRPALEQRKTVVSDRYLLSNVVYQGRRALSSQPWEVGLVATGGLLPDVTLVLDVPLEVAASRMQRPLDRMEQQGDAFHARVRQGFLDEASQHPKQIFVINAAQPIEQVAADVRTVMQRVMEEQR